MEGGKAAARPRLSSWLVLVPAVAAVFFYYRWTASSSGSDLTIGPEQRDYYNLLVDGFRQGQLSLPLTPDPELLALPDPYDPAANQRFRRPGATHDLSLYRGRYYIYFGVTPAVTLFLPFRLIAGAALPEALALVLLLFGTFLWSLALTQRVLRHAGIEPGPALSLALVLLLGLSNFAPYLLRRAAVYEVAVAAGCFFLMGAADWIARGLSGGGWKALGVASLLLGLAVGSRPCHALAAPLLAIAWWSLRRRGADRRERTRAALALTVPLALVAVGLLTYNYARFGNPLEFGQRYILADYHHPTARLFSFAYTPVNLFLMFLAPPVVHPEFPFVELAPRFEPTLPAGYLVRESIAGLLPCVPLAALAFVAPWWRRHRATGAERQLGGAASLLLAAGLFVALFVASFGAATARYLLDFGPPILAAAAIVLGGLWARARPPGRRLAGGLAILALLLHGVVVNAAVGLTGYYDWLKRRSPATYEAIERRFAPVQRVWLALRPQAYGDLQLRLRFPLAPPSHAEALVAAGGLYRHDVLCVRYLPDGRARLRFHHRGGTPPALSEEIVLEPGRVYTLDVAMGSLYPINAGALERLFPGKDVRARTEGLRVSLDGREILTGRYDFIPSRPYRVSIGEDRIDPQYCPAAFSGEIVDRARHFALAD